ncbi:MAG: hypothetical protein ACR2J4_09215, partial [Deinococcus sp.]
MTHPVRKLGLSTKKDEDGRDIIEEVDVEQYAVSNQYFFLGIAVSARDSINEHSTERETKSVAATSVVFSCTFLESGINAVIDSALLGNNDARISESGIRTLKILNDSHGGDVIAKLSGLEKYQILLSSIGVTPLAKGERIYQDADLLFRLRNSILHPKMYSYFPHEDGVKEYRSDRKLAQALSERFKFDDPINPTMGNPLISCLTRECATWSASISTRFWNHFLSLLPYGYDTDENGVAILDVVPDKVTQDQFR